MDKNKEKVKLIEQIKTLIDKDNNTTINTKYIQYFEIDELQEIIDSLTYKKENSKKDTSNYLDEIFSKCS